MTRYLEPKPLFIVGTGRCGTHFLEAVMRGNPAVVAKHTDGGTPLADSFIRYCAWNNIEVDLAGFREYRRSLIKNASASGKVYVESNAYLSLSVKNLADWYDARFILLVRKPQFVVNSHRLKGWYSSLSPYENEDIPIGIDPKMRANHFFGRPVPSGSEYCRWSALTQVGKIAWWVNKLNLKTFSQFQELPQDSWHVMKVENFDYSSYEKVLELMEVEPHLSLRAFDKIVKSKPGKGKKNAGDSHWTETEKDEFLEETAWLRHSFGYD